MKKIPTMFVRDWDGTIGPPARYVLNEPHPDCDWVFAGEGVATQKIDGTACLIKDDRLYKRREIRDGDAEPPGILVGRDAETGKTIFWIAVGEGPEDRYHVEAHENLARAHEDDPFQPGDLDGTYELIGPKVQGNPEHAANHRLVAHGDPVLAIHGDVPRDHDGLRDWLAEQNLEGLVFHHPDGRMAKIKKKDFGLARDPVTPA